MPLRREPDEYLVVLIATGRIQRHQARRRSTATMLIEIRLLARLFRLPLLRLEGVVGLRDDDARHTSTSWASARPRVIDTMPTNVRGAADRAHVGRDLAEAEAIIFGIDRLGSQQPRSRVKPVDKINS